MYGRGDVGDGGACKAEALSMVVVNVRVAAVSNRAEKGERRGLGVEASKGGGLNKGAKSKCTGLLVSKHTGSPEIS